MFYDAVRWVGERRGTLTWNDVDAAWGEEFNFNIIDQLVEMPMVEVADRYASARSAREDTRIIEGRHENFWAVWGMNEVA